MENLKVFLIEDDLVYSALLESFLQQYGNLNLKVFFNGKTAIKAIKDKPDIIITDYHLPDVKTDDLIRLFRNISPLSKILVVSKEDKMDIISKLLKSGSDDYIIKNENIKNLLYDKINKYKNYFAIFSKWTFNYSQIDVVIEEQLFFERKLAITNFIVSVIKEIIISNAPIYAILGPKGVGKEFLLYFIHKNSISSGLPVHEITINEKENFLNHCKVVINNQLLDSQNKYAQGGLFWIQEIYNYSLKDQELISNFINKTIKSDYVGYETYKFAITSTFSLDKLFTFNEIYEGLYYQIKLKSIELPSLCDRRGSIIVFTKKILRKINNGKKVNLSKQVSKKLKNYDYPENLSELTEVLKVAFSKSQGQTLLPEHIVFKKYKKNEQNVHPTLEDYCKKIIYNNLVRNNYNVLKTADILKISKSKVYEMLKRKELG